VLLPCAGALATGWPEIAGGVATVNWKLRCVELGAPEAVPAAGELSVALTTTCSPAVNGWSGANALPRRSGNAIKRPACTPRRDPRTITVLSCGGMSAGKLICDFGEASSVPGNGNTSRPTGEASGPCVAPPPPPGATIKPPTIAETKTAPSTPRPAEAPPWARRLWPREFISLGRVQHGYGNHLDRVVAKVGLGYVIRFSVAVRCVYTVRPEGLSLGPGGVG
jgi:hypothetical protein